MMFIHGADWRATAVDKRQLVDWHTYIASRLADSDRELEARVAALAEIVSQLVIRLPDADVKAVAEAVGFRVVEEGE